MRVLVTGVTSQLGHDVMFELKRRGHEAVGTARRAPEEMPNGAGFVRLDLADEMAVKVAVGEPWLDAVIHCAAWTAVDLRLGSPTFGKYHGELLTADNRKQHLIPRGFAHGFLVLSDEAELCYKCDDFYHPNDEGGLAWNDPDIGIDWPEVVGAYSGSASAEGYVLSDGTPLVLSEKDQKWRSLKETFRL